MSIELISVNIEGNRHLEERVLPFLKKKKPEVTLLQEVYEKDLDLIKAELGMEAEFVPLLNCLSTHDSSLGLWGLALLSKLTMSEVDHEYYVENGAEIPKFHKNGDPNSMNRGVLWSKVTKAGQDFWIATTHFIWSHDGRTTDLQREAYEKMAKILDRFPELVLTGDFNAPRGKEIFGKLAERYKDNIPPELTTTIDNNLHKAPNEINLVVDGLFSTDDYKVSQVEVVSGVSDHMAVACKISKGL
jgi:endonuclease/exonuclease/phosphatase family metal-dependent hydrolase